MGIGEKEIMKMKNEKYPINFLLVSSVVIDRTGGCLSLMKKNNISDQNNHPDQPIP